MTSLQSGAAHSIMGSGWTAGWLGPAVTSLHWGGCSLHHRLRLDCRMAGSSSDIPLLRGMLTPSWARAGLQDGWVQLWHPTTEGAAHSTIGSGWTAGWLGPAVTSLHWGGCSLHHGLGLDCRMAGTSCDIPSLRGLLTPSWARAGQQDGWGQLWHSCTEGLLTLIVGSGWTAGWLGPAVTFQHWGAAHSYHGLWLDCWMAGASSDIPALRGLLTLSWAPAGLQDGWGQQWHPCTEGAAHSYHGLWLDCWMAGASSDIPALRGLLAPS